MHLFDKSTKENHSKTMLPDSLDAQKQLQDCSPILFMNHTKK
jgi:hypothetical protein